jgi:hypothetical protein
MGRLSGQKGFENRDEPKGTEYSEELDTMTSIDVSKDRSVSGQASRGPRSWIRTANSTDCNNLNFLLSATNVDSTRSVTDSEADGDEGTIPHSHSTYNTTLPFPPLSPV